MHVKHYAFTLLLSASLVGLSPPALACKPGISCDIERIDGQVPCVELTTQDGSCDVAATWTCKPDDPPVTITPRSGPTSVTIGGGETAPMGLGATSYTWQRGEQRGTLEIIGSSRTFGDCSPQDETCAAAPASRPVQTPQLLILTLGLIVGKRRYKNSQRAKQT